MSSSNFLWSTAFHICRLNKGDIEELAEDRIFQYLSTFFI